MKTTTLLLLTLAFILINNYNLMGQCANASNIYTFVYNGNSYEIIKENKTWVNAASCAVERGGILAEINDANEQNAIFAEIANANITNSSTVAPDGGGGSYVWIGGNDIITEGKWVWDGNNDNNSTQFWQGTSNGSAVGGLYNNWGNEPDNYGEQDALGLSLNGWPLGVAGQWNDVNHANTLYFIVEYAGIVGVKEINNNQFKIFPNPTTGTVMIDKINIESTHIAIFDILGKNVNTIALSNSSTHKIDISSLNVGIYFIKLYDNNKLLSSQKLIVQ
ncbi:MAG: hypothetical protein B6I18_05480 [Bacteroidetes bacterium 4572_112]|nr:MAG: hypothetical protein B6I18_05480 [Bacteroidetes bacterium 4572_112]